MKERGRRWKVAGLPRTGGGGAGFSLVLFIGFRC